MNVKKVPTSKLAPRKTKALHVRALADYIAGPRAGDGEKVEHRSAVNLLNIDHDGARQLAKAPMTSERTRDAPPGANGPSRERRTPACAVVYEVA